MKHKGFLKKITSTLTIPLFLCMFAGVAWGDCTPQSNFTNTTMTMSQYFSWLNGGRLNFSVTIKIKNLTNNLVIRDSNYNLLTLTDGGNGYKCVTFPDLRMVPNSPISKQLYVMLVSTSANGKETESRVGSITYGAMPGYGSDNVNVQNNPLYNASGVVRFDHFDRFPHTKTDVPSLKLKILNYNYVYYFTVNNT